MARSPKNARRSSGSDAPTGCGCSLKRLQVVNPPEQDAVGVGHQHDEQHGRRRRRDAQGERRGDPPAPGLGRQRRDHPIGGAAGEDREEAQPGAAAPCEKPSATSPASRSSGPEDGHRARHQPDTPTIRIHAAGARPPLAVVVGHVAAGEADEHRDLQEEQRQRDGEIDDDEDLRVVVGERGQKPVRPPDHEAADGAGDGRGDPCPRPPPAGAERAADDPGHAPSRPPR